MKNKVGRPPMYKSPEAVQKAIDDYFNTLNGTPATITGMALAMGFHTRQSLYDYAEKPEFTYSIKRGILRIEHEAELLLIKKGSASEIFRLKNFGWTDSQHIEHSGGVTIKPIDWVGDDQ